MTEKGLFVANGNDVGGGFGGVQVCTREYIDLLKACGYSLSIEGVSLDQRFATRVIQQFRTSPYRGSISQYDTERICKLANQFDIIFLNQVNLASCVPALRASIGPKKPIVLLSHGAEVTDLLHTARLKGKMPLSGRLRPTRMSSVRNVLSDEIGSRIGVTAALCLSPYDAEFERWLGVPYTTWIPRIVTDDAIEWNPASGRFGYLGTLDHAPNLHGIVSVLDVLAAHNVPEISIRVVGAPPRIGDWLAKRYPNVAYLGPLNELELRAEASTWSAFLNPIFCQARGCSTKLSSALSWGLPIVTTPVGRRGYVLDPSAITECESPGKFASCLIEDLGLDVWRMRRQITRSAIQTMPTQAQIAGSLIKFLHSSSEECSGV